MAMGLALPDSGPISQMPSAGGMGTSNVTTGTYDNGGGFHMAMPKVNFFGDLASPYADPVGRPQGSDRSSKEPIPAPRMAGMAMLSPHIDNDSAFSMMNDLGSRVSYGDDHLPSRRMPGGGFADRGQRLATYNSSEQTGPYSLSNNATRLPQAGPVTGGGLSLNV